MALVEVNWNPQGRQLRTFGLAGAVVLGALGGLILWRRSFFGVAMEPGTARTVAIALWAVGGAFGLLAAALPKALLYPYVALTAASLPIGWALSHAVMGLIYYGMITPLGLIFRLLGRDPLERKLEPERASYWAPREQVTDPRRYYRQF